MKSKLMSAIGVALLGGVFSFGSSLALGAAAKMEAPAAKTAEAPKPANAVAALAAVNKTYADLTALVKAKRLTEVHDGAEKLIEASNALGAFTKELAAAKKSRVDGAIKNLAKALDTLHDAADQKNQAATEKALSSVDSLMVLINAQYAPAAPAK